MRLSKIDQDLDKLAAVAIALVSVAIIVYGAVALSVSTSGANNTYYIIFGASALSSCLIWLRVRHIDALKDVNPPSSRALFLLGNTLFFLFFGCAILALQLRSDVYVRPFAYFVFAALTAGALALEILACNPNARSSSLILTQIVLIGCMLSFSEMILFPSVVGNDPWFEQQFTQQLIQSGHIPQGSQYTNLPMFQLSVASTSVLAPLTYKWATVFSVGVSLVIIGALFTFLLGKSLVNAKAGLLGGLLLVTANQFINTGFWTIPTTLGGILVLITVYMLLRTRGRNKLGDNIVIMVVMSALILAHTISAMSLAVVLLSGLLAVLLYRTLNRSDSDRNYLSLTIATTFIIGMFGWWAYMSGSLNAVRGLIESQNAETFGQNYIINLPGMPLWLQVLSAAGFCTFVALSLVGCLHMISKKFGNAKAFVLVATGIIPVLIGFSRAFGVFLVAERWIFFGQILYAVPLALTLLIVVKLVHGVNAKALLLTTAVASVSLIMVLSPTANVDNHLLGSTTWERNSLTSSELNAVATIAQKSGSDLITDNLYASYAAFYYNGTNVIPLHSYLTSPALLLTREATGGASIHLGALSGTGIAFNTTFNPQEANATALGSRVYDSGSVQGYPNSQLASELES